MRNEPRLARLIWSLHAASFAFAGPLLGVALLGFSRAAHLLGLTPRWLAYLALAGAAALIAPGVATVAIVQGSPIGLVSFAGFGTWLLWLLVTGARLLRSD